MQDQGNVVKVTTEGDLDIRRVLSEWKKPTGLQRGSRTVIPPGEDTGDGLLGWRVYHSQRSIMIP